MNIGKHALSLAAALVLGGALLSISAGEAEARRNDNGIRCVAHQAIPGEAMTFFMPGEAHPKGDYKCGANGSWKRARTG
ncbi:MAG TPA: hypothetical protein VFH48_04980 [Chloroflexota bacterium]|nr:hypothetical protein [Chloroflexota bacterium]